MIWLDGVLGRSGGRQRENGGNKAWTLSRCTSLPLILALTSVLLVSCAYLGQRQQMLPNRAAARTFKTRTAVLRKAVERALAKRHFVIDSGQSSQLHLRTRWLQDGRYRTKVWADLRPVSRSRTELTVRLLLEKKPLWGQSWLPLDKVGAKVYEDLLEDVAMEIYRVLYDAT